MRIMNVCLVWLGMLSTAAAQSAPGVAARRPSFNVGVSSASPTNLRPTGQTLVVSVGTDIRISSRWSVRAEAGRRSPSRRSWTVDQSYYLAPAGSSSDVIAASQVTGTIAGEDSSLIDLALLVRAAHSVGRRVEIAALGGFDYQFVETRSTKTIPRSVSGDAGADVSTSPRRRYSRGVFDAGAECAVRVDDRWSLAAFALIGLQSPFAENLRNQVRAGGMVKVHF